MAYHTQQQHSAPFASDGSLDPRWHDPHAHHHPQYHPHHQEQPKDACQAWPAPAVIYNNELVWDQRYGHPQPRAQSQPQDYAGGDDYRTPGPDSASAGYAVAFQAQYPEHAQHQQRAEGGYYPQEQQAEGGYYPLEKQEGGYYPQEPQPYSPSPPPSQHYPRQSSSPEHFTHQAHYAPRQDPRAHEYRASIARSADAILASGAHGLESDRPSAYSSLLPPRSATYSSLLPAQPQPQPQPQAQAAPDADAGRRFPTLLSGAPFAGAGAAAAYAPPDGYGERGDYVHERAPLLHQRKEHARRREDRASPHHEGSAHAHTHVHAWAPEPDAPPPPPARIVPSQGHLPRAAAPIPRTALGAHPSLTEQGRRAPLPAYADAPFVSPLTSGIPPLAPSPPAPYPAKAPTQAQVLPTLPAHPATVSPAKPPTVRAGAGVGAGGDKKQALACHFCRERKIACGRPDAGCANQTCNQCARRQLTCEYPTESRRGQHKRTRKRKGAHGHDVNDAPPVAGAVQVGL